LGELCVVVVVVVVVVGYTVHSLYLPLPPQLFISRPYSVFSTCTIYILGPKILQNIYLEKSGGGEHVYVLLHNGVLFPK